LKERVATVLIVGAGPAGARCAETLRAEGFDGRVILVGGEREAPYERPALSKEFLAGACESESVLLRPPSFWADRGIELVLGTRIGFVDASRRTAVSTTGKLFAWGALVLATGARPRRFPGPAVRGVHTLRSLQDALALRTALRPGGRLTIVGAGFVGTEVASTAAGLGVEVVLLAAGRGPLERVLGLEVGALLVDRYRAHGVDVRLGARVTRFRADRRGRLREVVLADGGRVTSDAALVGLGAIPECPPVSGLAAEGGIATDACGRTSTPSVYACGDVASAWRPSLGRRLRVEHWTNAAGQGAVVARAILGQEEPLDEVPYFWSDQFGLRLQYVGHADEWAAVEIEGKRDSFSAIYRRGDGRLLAALFANRAREVAALRRDFAVGRAAA
jgi:3-phenylpropionate/trans-cinnamate dioxygenase ferredoxin reductase subunit